MGRRMKRRKFLANSAKAGLGLLAVTQVGGATPALAQAAPASQEVRDFTYSAYRAVLLISRGRTKSRLGPTQLKELMAKVVPGLRGQRKVHHVVPFIFHGWRDDVASSPAPWMPNGAMVFVQSNNMKELKESIKLVYENAKGLDHEMMILEPLGDLDSM
ncbi:MAG: hypothetical protein ACRDIC_01590 [bacterium]